VLFNLLINQESKRASVAAHRRQFPISISNFLSFTCTK